MSEFSTRALEGLQAVLVFVVRLQYRVARLEGRTHDEARDEALQAARLVMGAAALSKNETEIEQAVDSAIGLLYDAPERGMN
jgi:hypothetical protein